MLGLIKLLWRLWTTRRKGRLVVITGAGVSAPCGIPTFRDGDNAVYADPRRMALFNTNVFSTAPSDFYAAVAPLWHAIRSAEPGPIHRAIARLGARHPGMVVITTNVDGLHQRTGVHTVELHGNVRHMTCIDCGAKEDAERYSDIVADGKVPYCRECGGVMRPDVIMFGDRLSDKAVEAAVTTLAEAGGVLVVGTSFTLPGVKNMVNGLCHKGMVTVIAKDREAAEELQDWPLVEGRVLVGDAARLIDAM